MAINVQHGDISSALGLAMRSGEAVRQRQQQQQDMQFLNLVGDMQARADQAHANEVSQALGVDKFNAQNAFAQQQNTAENTLRQQQLAQQAASEQARMQQSTSQFQQQHQYDAADQAMQVEKARRDAEAAAQKQQAIGGLSPREQLVVQSTGRMPYVPNKDGAADLAQARLLQAEAKRVQDEINAFYATALKSRSKVDQIKNSAPPALPPALQQRKQEVESLLGNSLDTVINGAKLAEQAVQARTAAPAPQGQPQSQQGGTPVVKTMADYVALPSGATYVDAEDGQTYVKR